MDPRGPPEGPPGQSFEISSSLGIDKAADTSVNWSTADHAFASSLCEQPSKKPNNRFLFLTVSNVFLFLFTKRDKTGHGDEIRRSIAPAFGWIRLTLSTGGVCGGSAAGALFPVISHLRADLLLAQGGLAAVRVRAPCQPSRS